MVIRIIEINMGTDKTVTDSQYNSCFKQNTAAEGVAAIVNAGRFFINGFPIPGTAEEFERLEATGYTINQSSWLVKSETGYRVGKSVFPVYSDAAMAAAVSFPAGLEVRLIDDDSDGFTDRIELDYVEAFIVGSICENEDGTYIIRRSEPRSDAVWKNDGRIFDGSRFTADVGERISPENLDPALKAGDIALFRFTPTGWEIRKAKEIRGVLTGGEDHRFYQIGETKYEDAMRFSRDNLPISNRCGEYLNTHRYFGFTAGDKETSFWFVHTSDPNRQAAPAGFTSGENAATFLSSAIGFAKNRLLLTKNASDSDKAMLEKAILRAEQSLSSVTAPEILDYNTYLLYLVLNGSGEDIGARFAGFDYPGFGK